jgi:hypothetical protein
MPLNYNTYEIIICVRRTEQSAINCINESPLTPPRLKSSRRIAQRSLILLCPNTQRTHDTSVNGGMMHLAKGHLSLTWLGRWQRDGLGG